jgi:hypothetical protein
MKRKKARKAKPLSAKRAAKKTIRTKPRIAARSAPRTPPKKSQKLVRKAPKPALPDALDVLIMATAQELKLPLEPAWRPGVKFNLNLILRIAALVDEFPLPDDAEPAPVFHA